MRTVHVVIATSTPESIAAVEEANPEMARLMRQGPAIVQRYYTKRSADRLEAELRAAGIWIVERKTLLAGTIEDVFMHVTGLCPAQA